MDLIRSAVGSQSEYYQREVKPEYVEEGQVTKLPPINETGQIVGGGEKADRYGNVWSGKGSKVDAVECSCV